MFVWPNLFHIGVNVVKQLFEENAKKCEVSADFFLRRGSVNFLQKVAAQPLTSFPPRGYVHTQVNSSPQGDTDMKKHEWTHGQKAALAKAAGITPQHLSNILTKGVCGPDLAVKLEKASNAVLGLPPVGRFVWLYGPLSGNPLVGTQENAEEEATNV